MSTLCIYIIIVIHIPADLVINTYLYAFMNVEGREVYYILFKKTFSILGALYVGRTSMA